MVSANIAFLIIVAPETRGSGVGVKPGLIRPKTNYGFLRGENKDQELRVWEAYITLSRVQIDKLANPHHK